jgi:hypothetical protein
LASTATDTKHRALSDAGRRGALARWGEPGTRVVRLADLNPAERRIVLSLVDAVRNEKAEPVIETPGPAKAEVRGGSLERSAS